MSRSKLKNYVSGYIVVNIEGLNPEKFINLAAKNNVTMWDIERINFTTIQLKMKQYQYKSLKNVAKSTGCRCRIIKKYGMNFLLFKMSRRKFFIAGLTIFIAFIIYFSSFVWTIEINGNKNITSEKILIAADNAGLRRGVLKYNLNLRDVENSVLKQIDELSVINIKFSGTKAKVEIVERTMPPSIDSSEPINIIAARDGIILKVTAYKGQAVVKDGDFIKKDQVLISGILTNSQNAALGLVHSKGIVTAKTWYENIIEIPINYKYEEKTGKEKKIIYYKIGKKKIYIKNDNIDFKKYGKIEEKHYVSVAGVDTPVEKVTQTYYEIIDITKKISYSEALVLAEEKAEEQIRTRLPEKRKLIDRKVERQMGNGIVKVKVLYILEEDIGIPQKIK
jgi:similar to stage IV sporulation protein